MTEEESIMNIDHTVTKEDVDFANTDDSTKDLFTETDTQMDIDDQRAVTTLETPK